MPMLNDYLADFKKENRISTKGALSVVLVLTRSAKQFDFPLTESFFITEKEGQVKGLGKSAVQNILKDYGIKTVLAEEGGRTSRGSMGLMKTYIEFLNRIFKRNQLDDIEAWWIEQVKLFFSGKPFKLSVDKSKSISHAIKMLIKQAEIRQKENTGTTYVGAVFQHMVGAKLKTALKREDIECFGYSVADQMNSRNGDFSIEDSVIHVTTFPQEALIRKCQQNIDASLRPIIITNENGCVIARSLLESYGLMDRVEVYEIAQFISINVNELGNFRSNNTKATLEEIVESYNQIVEETETDPSLKIEVQ